MYIYSEYWRRRRRNSFDHGLTTTIISKRWKVCRLIFDCMCCISLIRSFAFETIKDRLPVIVTRIIDFLARHRARIRNEFGEVSACVRRSFLNMWEISLRKEKMNAKLVSARLTNYATKSLEYDWWLSSNNDSIEIF